MSLLASGLITLLLNNQKINRIYIYKLVKFKFQKYFFYSTIWLASEYLVFFRYQIFSLSKLNLFGRGVNLKFLLGVTNYKL